ncbi:hypothetical protein FRC00_009635 [Tulasnella sp. 408]|nr:hypothetical protein FRC00_009635 [Tulasnella sp. 408]
MDEESLEIELNKYITLDGLVGGASNHEEGYLSSQLVTKVGHLLRYKKRSVDATVQAVVDSGLLPNVIDTLSSSNGALVSEASWILLNVTLGTSQQRWAAVSAGALPRLVQVAASASDVGDVRRNALLALGNIAGDSPTLRDVFLKERAFRPALDILADPAQISPATVNTAAWVMETCTVPLKTSTFSEAIPILCKLILQKNEGKLFTTIVKALRRICSSSKSANMIFEAGTCPLLVQLCTSKNDDLREDALYLVSRFAYAGGRPLQSILDNDILEALQTCITDYAKTRKEACLVASNIAMATAREAKVLVKSSILPLLIEMVTDQEEEAKVQLEALKVLQNLAEQGEKRRGFFTSLVEVDCVEACCEALRNQDGDQVDEAARIIEHLIDTPWSGADDAIDRLEDSDGFDPVSVPIHATIPNCSGDLREIQLPYARYLHGCSGVDE